MDVVAVDEVDRADRRCRAEHLRTLDVLGNFHGCRLEGQFLVAIHAVGLCLQLEDTVFREGHNGGKLLCVGQELQTLLGCLATLHHLPGLGHGPRAVALAAVAHAHALQSGILTVQVGQCDHQSPVLRIVLRVHGGVRHRHVDRCRGRDEVNADEYRLADSSGVLGRLEHQLQVLVVVDGAVALRH